MNKTVLGLCLPIFDESKRELFEDGDVFDVAKSGCIFDDCNVSTSLVITEDGLMNTDHLVQQAAVSASYLNHKVLVILCAGKWTTWPSGFHRMPQNNASISKNWTFLYPTSLQDIIDYTADIVDAEHIPDTIIVQHLESVIAKPSNDHCKQSEKFKAFKLFALLTDLLAYKHAPTSADDTTKQDHQKENHKSEEEGVNNDNLENTNKRSEDKDNEASVLGERSMNVNVTPENNPHFEDEACSVVLKDIPSKSRKSCQLLCFAHMPRLLADSLAQFCPDIWVLTQDGVITDDGCQSNRLDRISTDDKVGIKYYLKSDLYYLKSVFLQDENSDDDLLK